MTKIKIYWVHLIFFLGVVLWFMPLSNRPALVGPVLFSGLCLVGSLLHQFLSQSKTDLWERSLLLGLISGNLTLEIGAFGGGNALVLVGLIVPTVFVIMSLLYALVEQKSNRVEEIFSSKPTGHSPVYLRAQAERQNRNQQTVGRANYRSSQQRSEESSSNLNDNILLYTMLMNQSNQDLACDSNINDNSINDCAGISSDIGNSDCGSSDFGGGSDFSSCDAGGGDFGGCDGGSF